MLLSGKTGLVLNVTNEKSLGWAIADLAHRQGARVGVGSQNEKILARVESLVSGRDRMRSFVVDFRDDAQLGALVDEVRNAYGSIDFLVHSAAFANKEDLTGRFVETSRDGFAMALDVSCYSLVKLCEILEPIMNDDASVVTLSYLGSTRAVGNYNVMGVAKAALEASVRYLAVDLGAKGIRVNTISPGPINTISARGVRGLLDMIGYVNDRAPLKRAFGAEEVANNTVYLLSDLSKGVTGQIVFVDSGYNIMGL